MKTPKPIFLLNLLFLQLTLTAQVQWYQNQDGNNPVPYGTVATSVQSFSHNTFIACYLWSTSNELNTWKISKSNTNGEEVKTFFITSNSATVECKVGKSNTVYVFEKSFTPDYMPQYIIYKLNINLQVTAQKSIEFPNDFYIYNISSFEIDDAGNIYFAGDGEYSNGAGSISPASFVLKSNKNLGWEWSRMDSSATSYSRLLVDRLGRVLVTEDYYTFFPQVRIKRFDKNGLSLPSFIVNTDPGRYSVNTAFDIDDNIIMYGGTTVGDSTQALYLKRISKVSGNVVYSKTHHTAPSCQLNDLKVDQQGDIYTLVTQYLGPDNQQSRISRISLATGDIAWNNSLNYATDSCTLNRLVMNEDNQFYAVGEKRSHTYFSKGYAVRLNKTGQMEGNFPAPDSVAFQRSHWLADGIIDNNNQLIAIGNTTDFDTISFGYNYFRSFALRFGNSSQNNNKVQSARMVEGISGTEEDMSPERVSFSTRLVIYPNPVQNQLSISNIDPEEYNQVAIYNMQGAMLQQQRLTGSMAKMDISNLADGVYLLTLRSAGNTKEKNIKFVVKK